jgi:hypothetical protein
MKMSKSDAARVPRNQATRAARLMAEARWKGVTSEERSQLMSAAGKKGGRPTSSRRCFCGATTMWTAASRNFDCCRKAGRITLVLKKGQEHNYDQER